MGFGGSDQGVDLHFLHEPLHRKPIAGRIGRGHALRCRRRHRPRGNDSGDRCV